MKAKLNFIFSAVCAFLALLLVFLLKTVDVAVTGVGETVIGLSGLNLGFRRWNGVRTVLYDATEWIGYFGIAVAAFFAVLGLLQWIRRKKLTQVDPAILLLAGLYFCTAALYVLFEVFPVNFRPLIMPGETSAEPSFPSSHTMLTAVIFLSAARLCEKYIRKENLRLGLQAACIFITVFTVVGRLLSGVHWLTDILGGALIAAALLFLYFGMLDLTEKKISAKGNNR